VISPIVHMGEHNLNLIISLIFYPRLQITLLPNEYKIKWHGDSLFVANEQMYS